MRAVVCLLASVALLPVVVRAESLDEYLAARKKAGVASPSTKKQLERLEGSHTIEIAAKVVGTIGKDGDIAMLVKAEGIDLYVNVGKEPAWTKYGVTDARMLISVKRDSLFSMIEGKMLASVEESEMAAYEERARKAEEARKAAEAEAADPAEGYAPVNPVTGNIGEITTELAPHLAELVPSYMSYVMGRNKQLSIQSARQIAESILVYSAQYGVEPRLVVALIQAESNFNPTTTSNKGAQGLGQLMPATAKSLGITDAYNIAQNVYGSVRTLRGHLDRQGKKTNDRAVQLQLALAAYNAGPGAVEKYGGVPPYKETQAYVARVVKTFRELTGSQ